MSLCHEMQKLGLFSPVLPVHQFHLPLHKFNHVDVCIDELMSSSLRMSNVTLARRGLSPTYHSLS